MKLAVGTVQFGLDYGVSNTAGKLGFEDAQGIVQTALARGIDLFDTAPAYGDSEQVLGHCLPDSQGRIITKTHRFPADSIRAVDIDEARRTFDQSLDALGREQVYGLMIHNPRDLEKPGFERLIELLLTLRDEGRIEKLGVSLYLPSQLDHVLSELPIDLVQAPLSLLDQRLLYGGQLARCTDLGIEFHARSLFLQGFLLSNADELPTWLSSYRPLLENFIAFCRRHDLTQLQAALAFGAIQDNVQQMVCGVASLRQFDELLEAMDSLSGHDLEAIDFSQLACADERLISPNRWAELRETA